jgi:hypothetical protein
LWTLPEGDRLPEEEILADHQAPASDKAADHGKRLDVLPNWQDVSSQLDLDACRRWFRG